MYFLMSSFDACDRDGLLRQNRQNRVSRFQSLGLVTPPPLSTLVEAVAHTELSHSPPPASPAKANRGHLCPLQASLCAP